MQNFHRFKKRNINISLYVDDKIEKLIIQMQNSYKRKVTKSEALEFLFSYYEKNEDFNLDNVKQQY